MFEKICNMRIRDMIASGKKMPTSKSEQMALLGKNWLQPISYKQFTNLIKGKNKFYQQMVARNGKEDPFRKTLIIIDEIHKVYSNTLGVLERPNPEVLQTMVQKSYDVSKNNSLKLLLMSATPITEDPTSSIKILNLLLEGEDRFSEDFDKFKETYCQDNGLFSDEGSLKFINKVSGLISYIDRSNDKSQFAYPVMNDIIINIETSVSDNDRLNGINAAIKELEEKILNKDVEVEVPQEVQEEPKAKKRGKKAKPKLYTPQQIKEFKAELKELKNNKKELDKQKSEPKNILDYVNKCFTKTKKKASA